MELIIIIVTIIAIIVIYSMMNVKIKELKAIALNKELNEIAKKLPTNKEICEQILKKLGNNTTQIEENENSEATLYIAIQDKITIGNTNESITIIQTVAHECLHSIQDKKMLIFNFIFSNIYLVFFIIICILTVCKKLSNEIMYSNIFLILSFIYYVIRVFLENDAMIKAQFLAREYMQESKYIDNSEIDKIYHGFEELNKSCIKSTNCSLFIGIMIKLVIFNVLALIF